jgi:hypothetical protein
VLRTLDTRTTITPMNRQTNAGHWQALRPDPRGRNAIDLPFTPAMAAAAARVLEEIRTSPAPTSDRESASSRGRHAGGAPRLPDLGAPPVNPRPGIHTGRNTRFPSVSGAPQMTSA